MRLASLTYFLCVLNALHSQTSSVIHESGYTHNYVLTDLALIENPSDTHRLKYIATVRFENSRTIYQDVGSFYDLLKIKARSLGANSYIVTDYAEAQKTVHLTVRLYFAAATFQEANEQQRHCNTLFVFNQTRFTDDTALFYLDQKKVVFDPAQYYSVPLTAGRCYTVSVNGSNMTSTRIKCRQKTRSRFFIMPASQKSIVLVDGRDDRLYMGFAINGAAVRFKINRPYELSYAVGRLFVEAYKARIPR